MLHISSSEAMAAVASILEKAGFVPIGDHEDARGFTIRLFEDSVSAVALSAYSSWTNLEQHWTGAQGLLVELMSERLTPNEAKSWEGYLVLMTSEDPLQHQLAVDRIRRDTSRVRKLVLTGSELTSLSAVKEAMLPVLPLELDSFAGGGGQIMDRLPELLEAEGISKDISESVVRAFRSNRSPLEEIWRLETVDEA